MEQIDNKLLERLGKELMDDIKVDLINVRDKAMTVSTIRAKWVMKFFREKEQMAKLQKAKKQVLSQEVNKLQTSSIPSRSMSKMRLEEQIVGDNDQIKRLNDTINKQAEVIQFMEYALNIVSDFNFTVKHALDAIKLEQA
jgi:hypothetical protein